MNLHNVNQMVIHVTNTASVTSTAAAILGWLPPLLAAIASLFTIFWLGLQIVAHPLFNKLVARCVMTFGKKH